MTVGRLKRLVFPLATTIAVLALALLLAEVVLAVGKFNEKSTIRFVPGKGITRVPNAYYRHTKEGFSEGHFNSHGFRDFERSLEKPDGVYRIAIFGDSYVEALQVDLKDAFPAVLERRLNERFDEPRFEVLAFGQSGFGTTDSLMRYLNFGAAFEPDLVLLAFLTGNDFRNNHRLLNSELNGYYYGLDRNGELVLDTSLMDAYAESLTPARRLFIGLKQRSYVVSLLAEQWYHQRVKWNKRKIRAEVAASNEELPKNAIDEFSDLNIYRKNPTGHWREAYDITDLVIREFDRVVRENGAQFALVTLTNSEQLKPEFEEWLTATYGPEFDVDHPDKFVRELAADAGIPCLSLVPAFREHQDRNREYLHGFGNRGGGHWNENGHRLAAELLLEFLVETWSDPGNENSPDRF